MISQTNLAFIQMSKSLWYKQKLPSGQPSTIDDKRSYTKKNADMDN